MRMEMSFKIVWERNRWRLREREREKGGLFSFYCDGSSTWCDVLLEPSDRGEKGNKILLTRLFYCLPAVFISALWLFVAL